MPKYNVGHAARARRRFLLDLGHDGVAIDARPPDGWLGDGPDRFVCYDSSGSELGKVACRVQFLNEDGGAEVTFADGDGGVVNIGEDEEDDPEEEEEEDLDFDLDADEEEEKVLDDFDPFDDEDADDDEEDEDL